MSKKKTPAAELMELQAEVQEQTQELAAQLKYDGSLSPDALQEGIIQSRNRVSQELFEMGARLLLLKEQCPHGEFGNRCEQMELDRTLVKRTMQAALKFSKSAMLHHLEKMSRSKVFELLVLDDDEVKQLSSEGSVRGIELDEIDSMSVSELRKRLRDSQADIQAKDEVLAKNATKINKLQQSTAKARLVTDDTPEADLILAELKARASGAFIKLGAVIQEELIPSLRALDEHAKLNGAPIMPFFNERMSDVDNLLDGVTAEFSITEDFEG